MINLGTVLKTEIRRLARREIRANTTKTQKAVARYRREIAHLKRQVREQHRKLTFLETQERKRLGQRSAAAEPANGARFSPRSVQAQRRRLGLSAHDYAKLVGVSPLTIYNWEHGKTRPQVPQLAALVALRGIGKRDAMARLALLREEQKAAPRRGRKARAGKPRRKKGRRK